MAIANPLLEDISISGARGILMNITASSSTLSMDEVDQASTLIYKEAHEEANIIWGTVFDETVADEIRVTVIATGIGADIAQRHDAVVTSVDFAKRRIQAKPDGDFRLTAHSKGDREAQKRQAANGNAKGSTLPSFDETDWDVYDTPTFIRKKAD
jgi:cell division protein FtsZ